MNYDGPLDPPEDDPQVCPSCDGEESHACALCEGSGKISLERYVDYQNEKARRLGWLKVIVVLLIPNVLLFMGGAF
jgi:hypothetical protein